MAKSNDKLKDGSLSAFEKAGLEGDDPRVVPIKLDGPAPEGDDITYPDYSGEEHETWKILFKRQKELLPGRAAREYAVSRFTEKVMMEKTDILIKKFTSLITGQEESR